MTALVKSLEGSSSQSPHKGGTINYESKILDMNAIEMLSGHDKSHVSSATKIEQMDHMIHVTLINQ